MNDLVTMGTQRTLLTFLLISIFTITAQAQQNYAEMEFSTDELYRVTLNDGSVIVGHFLSKTPEILTLSTSSLPKVEIPFGNIKKLELVDKGDIRSDGTYWFPNPNPTRYFFSPSAFNLKKGEGYYQNSYLIINSLNYGVTDFFSIGGGFELISTFSPDTEPFFFFTPKINSRISENFYISGGLLIARADEFTLGTTYALATYGNHNDNITAGLGWGFIEGDFSNEPIITLGGMTRIARKFSLITENWFVPDVNSYYPIISYGVRFFGEKIAVDLGFLNNGDIVNDIAIGIPYVDFLVKF